jgi:hypothetical protein
MQVTENKGARHILIAKIRGFARIRRPFSDFCFGWLGSTCTAFGPQFLTADQWPLITVFKEAIRKLEFLLSPISSTTFKFLIDNFYRLSPTFRPHSSTTIRQDAISSGAPSFAAFANGGVSPIANRHATEKLEFSLNAIPSITSKFLIDNFHRDLVLSNASSRHFAGPPFWTAAARRRFAATLHFILGVASFCSAVPAAIANPRCI